MGRNSVNKVASKAKKLRQQAQARKPFIRSLRFPLVLASVVGIILVVLISSFRAGSKNLEVVQPTAESARSLFQTEFADLITNGGQSGKLPASVREKLKKISQLNVNGQLEITIVPTPSPYSQAAMMAAAVKGVKPGIWIYAPRFMQMAQVHSNREAFQSLLTVSLIHESIHLENWPERQEKTDQEVDDEEIRAYAKTSLEVVAPMLQAGMMMMESERARLGILRSCANNPQCPQFRKSVLGFQKSAY